LTVGGTTFIYLRDFAIAAQLTNSRMLNIENECFIYSDKKTRLFAPLEDCVAKANRMLNQQLGGRMAEALLKLVDNDNVVVITTAIVPVPPLVIGDKRKCCGDDRKKKKKRIRGLVKEVRDAKERVKELEELRDLFRHVIVDMRSTTKEVKDN